MASNAIIVSVTSEGTGTALDGFDNHLRGILPQDGTVQSIDLSFREDLGRLHGIITLSATEENTLKRCVIKLQGSRYKGHLVHAQVDSSSKVPSRVTDENNDNVEEVEEYNGNWKWQYSKKVANYFFVWLHESPIVQNDSRVDLRSVDREKVSRLWTEFSQQTLRSNDERIKQGLVMARLRSQRLMKSRKYNDGVVICSFAKMDKTFAPAVERKTARDKMMEQRRQQIANKGGIEIAEQPITEPMGAVMPMNQNVSVEYHISIADGAQSKIHLNCVHLTGSHKGCFTVKLQLPCQVGENSRLQLSFRANGTGVYRVNIDMLFEDAQGHKFSILRSLLLRSGDSDMYDIMKPRSAYAKKRRKKEKPVNPENVVGPPRSDRGGSSFKYKGLKHFKVPVDVRELVENREMEGTLLVPSVDTSSKNFPRVYPSFWCNLLWVSELQAYEDIKLFDMENAALERSGRFFKLYVAGLAEGRPSVLRGDLVNCTWQGKMYQGRVYAVQLLDVLLEFHSSFHRKFNVQFDRVDLVRFTFSRTTFRTSHTGSLGAPKSMGQKMLMPTRSHVAKEKGNVDRREQRKIPIRFSWASQTLNEEQQNAVKQIVQGALRPIPYVIFGPPGTGKTTTIVETVYQLARLHTYNSNQRKLKILLVAPSNDASDILVEKLAQYFPPSEMLRVLAYTRTINQVPHAVRPYVREGLERQHILTEINFVQIVVSTVNLAARLWCTGNGIRKGTFDILCVDEAGHATEPELIGVASTLMEFEGKSPGQLILAGDPQQLGPTIASDLCKKFGMDVSYMERLVKKCPAYAKNDSGEYPSELITLLVRNYRSHPAILKLPNEMFYDNKLITCGDNFVTHSMARWEHLPTDKGFPVLFHSIDGENLREGSSPSWFNPQEAMTTVDYVKLLAKHSRPSVGQDEIGIITPYARQVQKIRLALKANDLGDVKVGSVETFQGQERRCIIISTVRSENEFLDHDRKYNLGFVANEKRFNVAVTRAKALLIIVGNPKVLATDKKNWLPLLRYCRDNGSWLGDEWNEEEVNEDENSNFLVVDADSEEERDHDWHVVSDQENYGFINREE
jgi:helicase MOV-10